MNLRVLQTGQLAGELSHVGFEWSSIVGAAVKPDGAFLEGWFTYDALSTWPVTVEKTPFLYALKKVLEHHLWLIYTSTPFTINSYAGFLQNSRG